MTASSSTESDLHLFPVLSFYYPGLSWYDLITMPRAIVKLYAEALPKLIAQRQMVGIETASYPHMKRAHQKKLVRQLQREMRVATVVRPKTDEQRAQMAAVAGIGVVLEPAKDAGSERDG